MPKPATKNRKPKLPQKADPKRISKRDLFQTPNYAVEILMPFVPDGTDTVWECAAGEGKIVNYIRQHGYHVIASDINKNYMSHNFLTDEMHYRYECIITNPPYSLKKKFYERCRQLNVPFALLIPADYCGWIIQAAIDGCEKIIPTRRIDYITPKGKSGKSSSSLFHSMWLTWGFKLGRSETFVELTQDMKRNI